MYRCGFNMGHPEYYLYNLEYFTVFLGIRLDEYDSKYAA